MRPKIVVLDGYTLAPTPGRPNDHPSCRQNTVLRSEPHTIEHGFDGQTIDWNALQDLGHVTIYDRSTEAQTLDRAIDATIVLTNKTPITGKIMSHLPGLRYIGILATGVNVVDLAAARQHQIVVTHAPRYSTDSVAQHVFALILELVQRTAAHDQAVHEGQWTRCPDFSFTVTPITELVGKTLGIVGLGAIGRRVAQIGSAFGLSVAAAHQTSMTQVHLPGVHLRWLELDQLAQAADILTLHCPLTDQTHRLVNTTLLEKMKPSAILINTSRGALVDEDALAQALVKRRIAGAGLDVLSTEPPAVNNPLLSAPHCVITPHIAWASVEARRRLMDQVVLNVKAYLDGMPINQVA